jgi:putative effector of murein hydrolase
MSDFQLSVLCLLVTLGLYFANKRLYRRFHKLPLMPLVFTPILLVLILVFGHISYQTIWGDPLAAVAAGPGDHRLCRAGV